MGHDTIQDVTRVNRAVKCYRVVVPDLTVLTLAFLTRGKVADFVHLDLDG